MNTEFLKELYTKIPRKIELNYTHWDGSSRTSEATLETVALCEDGTFLVTYEEYIGCGGYDHYYREYSIEDLMKENQNEQN